MERVKVSIEFQEREQAIEFSVKSEWNELDFDDLKLAARRIFCFDDEEVSLANGELFTQLVDLDHSRLKSLTEQMLLDDDGVEALIRLYDSIEFVTRELPVFYSSKSTEYKEYCGPADNLGNLSWWQFIKAEKYYEQYLNGFREPDLNATLSFLYWKDSFSRDLAPKMAKVIASWPLEDRKAMFFNYMALRNYVLDVPDQFDPVEREVDPIKALQAAADPQEDNSLEKVAFRLAGDKFGTVPQILDMLVPDVFSLIDQIKETAE